MKSLENSNRKLKKSVSALQKCEADNDTDSSLSSDGTSHFQKGVEMLQNCYPKIVLVGGIRSGCSRYQNLSLFHVSVDQAPAAGSVLWSNCSLLSLDVAICHS